MAHLAEKNAECAILFMCPPGAGSDGLFSAVFVFIVLPEAHNEY